MARYKAKAKTKANNKSLIAVVIVILVAVLVVAASIGSLGFTKKNFKTWFNNWGKPTTATPTTATWGGVVDGNGKRMNNVATYAMPTAMAFYSDVAATSENYLNPSVTVTCSHNFELNNILVDWSVEYQSGASAADIVTVTPTSDGSLTAKVSCSAPFDTQLTLKATLRGIPEKTATCTIDFMKRIDYLNSVRILGWKMEQTGGIQIDPVFSIGTVEGEIVCQQAEFQITNDFQKDVKSYLKFNIDFISHYEEVFIFSDFEYYFENWSFGMFIQGFNNYDEAHKNAIYYAWNAAYANNNYSKKNNVSISLDMDVMYNGTYLFNFAISGYLGDTTLNQLSCGDYASTISPDLTLNNVVI